MSILFSHGKSVGKVGHGLSRWHVPNYEIQLTNKDWFV